MTVCVNHTGSSGSTWKGDHWQQARMLSSRDVRAVNSPEYHMVMSGLLQCLSASFCFHSMLQLQNTIGCCELNFDSHWLWELPRSLFVVSMYGLFAP